MGEQDTSFTKGFLCVVIAAVVWGTLGPAAKTLFEAGISPFELVQIRVTLSSILLALCLGILARRTLKIRLKDLSYFLLLGGVAMAFVQITYFYAISKIQVAAAILLQYMATIMVTLFSIFFWRERLTILKILALCLAIGGCFLVVGGYNLKLLQMNRLGILGGLASAVCLASYTLLGERGMHRYSPWTVLFYSFLFAAFSWHILYPPFHYLKATYTLTQWALILYIVVFGTILTFGLYLLGINHIRSTRASIIATLEPICAGFFSFIILGETLEALQIVGGASVISAIIVLQIQREQSEVTPELIRTRREKNN